MPLFSDQKMKLDRYTLYSTDLTKVEWSSLSEVGLDRSVESRIWRWGRGYSTAEQSPPARFAVQCAVCHQRIISNTCACALCTAHAQYIIMVKGGGCKKSDAGADEKLK